MSEIVVNKNMIGISVQIGRGKTERKEGPSGWEDAQYVGDGEHLLFSNMPGVVNLHHSVLAKKHKDYEENICPNVFEIKRNGDLEIEIKGHEIFGEYGQEFVSEIQEGVFLMRHMSKRILFLQETIEGVELQIFHTMNGIRKEVSRVKFAKVPEENVEEKLIKEAHLDAEMEGMARGNDLL